MRWQVAVGISLMLLGSARSALASGIDSSATVVGKPDGSQFDYNIAWRLSGDGESDKHVQRKLMPKGRRTLRRRAQSGADSQSAMRAAPFLMDFDPNWDHPKNAFTTTAKPGRISGKAISSSGPSLRGIASASCRSAVSDSSSSTMTASTPA